MTLPTMAWEFGPPETIECECDQAECVCIENAEADEEARRKDAELARAEAREERE